MNTIKLKNSWLIILLTSLTSCGVTQHPLNTSKKNSYQYNIFKTGTLKNPIVNGVVYDKETNVLLRLTSIRTSVKNIYRADKNGIINFTILPGIYSFTGIGYSYEFCEAKKINLQTGDSLTIKFYVKPYTKILD